MKLDKYLNEGIDSDNIKITIFLERENAAFEDDMEGETKKILLKVVNDIYRGKTNGVIFDTNGNRVGKFEVKENI